MVFPNNCTLVRLIYFFESSIGLLQQCNFLISVPGTNIWCSPDELQILVPLINQSQAEKVTGLEDLTKVYLDRVLDYMITQVRIQLI